jgi:UDP-N-acetylmuramyl pentapeptide phosphotransferase/UDP-N-acetylglucosamine-1-phosphate transferase
MMFYLHRLTEQFKGFNVFYYVTFRAVLAAVTAFAISLIFGNYIIRKLISLKIGQPIRNAAEVRQLAELHGRKEGTPTMGGVLIIGSLFSPPLCGRGLTILSSGSRSSAWSISARSGSSTTTLRSPRRNPTESAGA